MCVELTVAQLNGILLKMLRGAWSNSSMRSGSSVEKRLRVALAYKKCDYNVFQNVTELHCG